MRGVMERAMEQEQKLDYRSLSALVVDDNLFMRRLILEMLRNLGLRRIVDCDCVNNAMKTCTKFQPDIIILDWYMPDALGSELIRVVRSSPVMPMYNAAIMVVTTAPTRVMLAELQAYGVNCVLKKPFSPAEFKAKLEFVVRRSTKTAMIEA
jgi:two-component system, chemotaxis family, chemotaxis protein CheY